MDELSAMLVRPLVLKGRKRAEFPTIPYLNPPKVFWLCEKAI